MPKQPTHTPKQTVYFPLRYTNIALPNIDIAPKSILITHMDIPRTGNREICRAP